MIFQHHLQPQVSFSFMADDTKCLKPVCNKNISDCLSMQIDLHNLTTWSQHWNLKFNAAKCALDVYPLPSITSFASFSSNCSQDSTLDDATGNL